jgi:hypothetical protein
LRRPSPSVSATRSHRRAQSTGYSVRELEEDGRESAATTKRLRNLERELARKEKALAEAAAFLVLKKTVANLHHDEDDDTDGPNES